MNLLFLLLLPTFAEAQDLERAPYLQMVTPDSATIVWKTWDETDGELRWGTSPDALDETIPSLGAMQHSVQLDGLSPETRYYYAVYSGDTLLAGDETHSIRTSPPHGSVRPLRMWVVGDSGTGLLAQMRVRDAFLEQTRGAPDLFIHVGDMAYSDGEEQEFTSNFYRPYADILKNTPVWPAMGNHEGHTSDSATETGPYYDGYVLPRAGEVGGLPSGTEAYYSFDWGTVHFVVLDSHQSPRGTDDAMLTWMAEDIAATDQPWLIAFWHHPPYTKGSHDSDTEGSLIDMRENALPLLEAAGVDLVLGGHSHIYERSYLLDGGYSTPSTTEGILDDGDGHPDGDGAYAKSNGLNANEGAVYVVAGHGGTGVTQSGIHPLMQTWEVANGSVLLDLEGDVLHLRNIRQDGAITDEMVLMKGDKGLILETPDGRLDHRSGSEADVRWKTLGEVGPVDVSFTCDDGATWHVVAEDLENTETWSWTVPEVQTSTARLRISGADGVQDTSGTPFSVGPAVPVVPVDFGSTWRFDGSGIDHGSAWLDGGFDDSGWDSGPGQLGYGDGDEATELDDSTIQPSTYFRRAFTLDVDSKAARLEVLFDDGVAVYVDGALVGSANVAGLDFGEWASDTSLENDRLELNLDPGAFGAGEHQLAVMVKQAGATSSDLSFDLRITLEPDVDADAPPCSEWPPEPVPEVLDEEGCSCAASFGGAGLPAVLLLALRRRRKSNAD
jgi:hypothetical protein